MAKMKIPRMPAILEEAIQLENSIGDLYKLFKGYYPEDETFWHRLSLDEAKHASVLKALKPWVAMGVNQDKYILPDLVELKNKNIAIRKIIQKAVDEPPTREVAFNLAYKIELTASEVHFQKKMSEASDDNKLLKSMQELCGADKDHQKRIRSMMNSLGIDVT